ncbi:hypothetical protein SUGI_0258840 [Cryptomeria japonica]|nr:hypothetical protein SUGI_0258840 [Cryptomeria japonica]
MKFNGACRGNLGESGYGAIIRDELGDMLGAKFGPLGVSTNNIAEVTILEAGLECPCPRQLSAADEIPNALLQIFIREKSSIPKAGIG